MGFIKVALVKEGSSFFKLLTLQKSIYKVHLMVICVSRFKETQNSSTFSLLIKQNTKPIQLVQTMLCTLEH
jgi:hypothetical protein